ncbi:MAG TPA: type II toxin-antitoxin system VapC family toxin [Polyangiaceae bacterium]
MSAIVADTGGLLRALAADSRGRPSWPAFANALLRASRVIVPALVLAEVDYFLRAERAAMRKLTAEILDPATTYELEPVFPQDLVRALTLDAKFASLELGLVDGMVAAVAERRRVYRVLTTDRRDLMAVRIGARYDRALEIVPT